MVTVLVRFILILIISIGCNNDMCLCTREDLNSCIDCRDSVNIYLAEEQMCFTECPNPANEFYDRTLKDCIVCHEYCN